jgi:hypothetical protein
LAVNLKRKGLEWCSPKRAALRSKNRRAQQRITAAGGGYTVKGRCGVAGAFGRKEWSARKRGQRWRPAAYKVGTAQRNGGGRGRSGAPISGRSGRGVVGLTGGPRGLLSKSEFNSKDFKLNSACSNLIQSKQDLPWLEKFEIKYGCEGFDVRNNFLIGTSLDSKLILNKN